MSIKTQIDRIAANVTSSLAAIESKGVEVPEGSNSDSLPMLIGENLMKNITVDDTVTGAGANPVSGAAVYAYAQKKVIVSTADLTAGTSALADGEVYLVYE